MAMFEDSSDRDIVHNLPIAAVYPLMFVNDQTLMISIVLALL